MHLLCLSLWVKKSDLISTNMNEFHVGVHDEVWNRCSRCQNHSLWLVPLRDGKGVCPALEEVDDLGSLGAMHHLQHIVTL